MQTVSNTVPVFETAQNATGLIFFNPLWYGGRNGCWNYDDDDICSFCFDILQSSEFFTYIYRSKTNKTWCRFWNVLTSDSITAIFLFFSFMLSSISYSCIWKHVGLGIQSREICSFNSDQPFCGLTSFFGKVDCFQFLLWSFFHFCLGFHCILTFQLYAVITACNENIHITVMVGFGFKCCHTNYQNGDYMGSLNKKASGTQCFYNCFRFVLGCNVIGHLLPPQKVVK